LVCSVSNPDPDLGRQNWLTKKLEISCFEVLDDLFGRGGGFGVGGFSLKALLGCLRIKILHLLEIKFWILFSF
jgi:hypothetical protein